MKKIAIIPARSGSKGLKDKNIIDLCGKPMMAYSIEAAINAGQFDDVVVSTDSKKYEAIAKAYGANVLIRSKELANDEASTFVVIEDVLKQVTKSYDYFMLLQPTSPMRNAKHVKEAIKRFEEKCNYFDFLVSVKEAEHANILVKPLDENYSLRYFDTDFSNYKRQNYKEYSPNGAIFIGKCKEYMEQKHFFGAKSIGYIMNAEDSIDVDTVLDYEVACLCMKRNSGDRKIKG